MSADRVVPAAGAAHDAAAWRSAGERVALAEGVFDLLDAGHAHFLAEARGDAHRLVVAILDDATVAAHLGAGRPVSAAGERARLVAALRGVDRVVVCSGGELEALAAALRPERRAGDPDDRAGRVRIARIRALHGGRP